MVAKNPTPPCSPHEHWWRWSKIRQTNTAHDLTTILVQKASLWEAFLVDEEKDKDNKFKTNIPWSMRLIGNNTYVITNSLQTWEHIPAAFWSNWICIWQHIDMWRYISIMEKSKQYLKQSEDNFLRKYWRVMSPYERCQAAMYSVSHFIATILQPTQNDIQYEKLIEKKISSGSKELTSDEVNKNWWENCLLKSAIAHHFLKSIHTLPTRFLLNWPKKHAYLEVDIWSRTLRLDANCTKPVYYRDENNVKKIFYTAMIHDGSTTNFKNLSP